MDEKFFSCGTPRQHSQDVRCPKHGNEWACEIAMKEAREAKNKAAAQQAQDAVPTTPTLETKRKPVEDIPTIPVDPQEVAKAAASMRRGKKSDAP